MRIRLLAVVLVAAAAGGLGVWLTRPDLIEEPVGRVQAVWADWRQTGEAWREHGLDRLAALRRQGAEMIARARQAVGMAPAAEQPVQPPARPVARLVVWASAEGELLRAEVPGAAHEDFVAALRQAQATDRDRLLRLAGQRFHQEAEPLVMAAVERVPAYVDEVVGGSTQLSSIANGFSALEGGAEPNLVQEQALRLLGDRFADLFRQRVLRPETAVPALRGVAGKVIADVRVDLVRSCDRYDQAFQSFLNANVHQVEGLSQDGRWIATEWSGGKRTFRSLCQTLRVTESAASWFDDAVLRTVGEPSMAAHELIRELARPAAAVVNGMIQSYDGVVMTLSSYGVPPSLAKLPAFLWSYGASSPTMLTHILGLGVPAETRTRVAPALAEATRAGITDVVGALDAALAAFVDGELAGMVSGVTARVDGARSRQ